MAYKPTYLQKIRVSRGIRPVGEVFAMHLKGVGYLFGRVVRNDCAAAGLTDPHPWPRQPGRYLVYVYRDLGGSIGQIPALKRSRLLIPPKMIGGSGWTRGYFVPVRQDVLTPEDVLPVHCFYNDIVRFRGKPPITYLDEYGNWLDKRSNPCARWGFGEYGSLEAAIAEALGLPHPELPGWSAPSVTSTAALPTIDVSSIATGEGECSAVLHLPRPTGGASPDDVEDALIDAVERKKAGTWVGHGTDLATGTVDIQFVGPNGRELLRAIKLGLDPLRKRLPQGWYVTARIGDDGEERRVTV